MVYIKNAARIRERFLEGAMRGRTERELEVPQTNARKIS